MTTSTSSSSWVILNAAEPLVLEGARCDWCGRPPRPSPHCIAVRPHLIYLEDRAALDALVDAVEAAYELREQVFGGSYRDGAADGDQENDNDRAPEAAEA